jgi:5'-nucleotidase
MSDERPLILVTNDDGIESPGLRAAARAALDLGDLLIVAPCHQWSSASRCFSADASGTIHARPMEISGKRLEAFCADGAPAQVVLHAVLELAPRQPDLVLVGINYGENLGADVTVSGTIGAAIQGASCGIPGLAVSLQTPKETHALPSDDVDFEAAIHFTRLFARRLLAVSLPFDVDVLKIDIPDNARPETPWRLTRISRHTYFRTVPAQRDDFSSPGPLDYNPDWDSQTLEPDSDIFALAVDRVVSVAPLSLDLTSRADPGHVEAILRREGL